MEKFNYTESEFISRSEINVDILPVNSSKNKFGIYHQSHKIKVKYVILIKKKKKYFIILIYIFKRIIYVNLMYLFLNIRVNGQMMRHIYQKISNNLFDLLIDQFIINVKLILLDLVLLFMIGKC
jgi:hypothetical protein